jgi:hypothetical protein
VHHLCENRELSTNSGNWAEVQYPTKLKPKLHLSIDHPSIRTWLSFPVLRAKNSMLGHRIASSHSFSLRSRKSPPRSLIRSYPCLSLPSPCPPSQVPSHISCLSVIGSCSLTHGAPKKKEKNPSRASARDSGRGATKINVILSDPPSSHLIRCKMQNVLSAWVSSSDDRRWGGLGPAGGSFPFVEREEGF